VKSSTSSAATNGPTLLCQMSGSVTLTAQPHRSDKVSKPMQDRGCFPVSPQSFVVPFKVDGETRTEIVTLEPHGVVSSQLEGEALLDSVLYSPQMEIPMPNCLVMCYPRSAFPSAKATHDPKGCLKSCIKKIVIEDTPCTCTLQKRLACSTASAGEQRSRLLGEGRPTRAELLIKIQELEKGTLSSEHHGPKASLLGQGQGAAATVQSLTDCYSCPKPCPAGLSCSECSAEGKRECSLCADGTFSKAGVQTCSKCPAGSSSSEGSGTCAQCPEGTSSASGDAQCSAQASSDCAGGAQASSSASSSSSGDAAAKGLVCTQFKQLVHFAPATCADVCANELLGF